jgi:molybdopterin/thiamine biosynthesis adenylyltransferase
VVIIGVGGIGALLAVVLGKMGVGSIAVVDDDKIEAVNIATQFHQTKYMGWLKVDSVEEMLHDFAEMQAHIYDERFEEGSEILHREPSIIVSAVDSIDTRKDIWRLIQDMEWKWYIDARMGAEAFHAYIVDKAAPEWYDTIINNSKEEDVPELPCTEKATIYTAAIAAGHLGHIVKQIATDERPPFRIVHNIPTNELYAL